jgi:predicted metal-binding protein
MVTDTLIEAEAAVGIYAHENAMIHSSALIFSPQLLELCKANACGMYNKSWTCPPACETVEEQRKKILSYKNIFVFTTKHDLEDSFDYEGMTQGSKLHSLLTIEIRNKLGDDYPVYGAGSCPVCRGEDGNTSCTFPDPCRYPEKKIGSIEAAGINVTELSKAANIAYNNGPNTVTFFSMILLK